MSNADNCYNWINVKDKLPEDGIPVLIWDGIHIWEAYRYYDEETWIEADNKGVELPDSHFWYVTIPYLHEKHLENDGAIARIDDMGITHWMKLPSPPLEEENT